MSSNAPDPTPSGDAQRPDAAAPSPGARPGGFQSMWSRLRGMVQADKPGDARGAPSGASDREELVPTWDAAPPSGGAPAAQPVADPAAIPLAQPVGGPGADRGEIDVPLAQPVEAE